MNRLGGILLVAALTVGAADTRASDDPSDRVVLRRGDRLTVLHRQIRPEHNALDGLALSPNGSIVVSATFGRPANELSVFRWSDRSGWNLNHPDPNVRLTDPAFAADNARIAIVVEKLSPRTFGRGPSEIWITDPSGGDPITVIPSRGRRYQHPAFSPDGRRVAYFRSVDPVGQLASAYALFEYDLTTGHETRLARQAFEIPCGLSYDPKQTGLFYCALFPMREIGTEPEETWQFWPDLEYEHTISGHTTFFLRVGGDVASLPRPVAPGFLLGVTRGGLPIISSKSGLGPYPPTGANAQVSWAGSKALCSWFGASSDGRTFIANTDCTTNDPADPVAKPSTFQVMHDGRLHDIPLRSLRFEDAHFLTIPAEPNP